LEFPVVFVTGMEDGTFPHQRSLGEADQIAEERRLAYVALTRARERLYISRADVRSAFGLPQQMPESRFVSDIPAELVEWRREQSSTQSIRASGGGGWGGRGGDRDRGADTWASPVRVRATEPRIASAGSRKPGEKWVPGA